MCWAEDELYNDGRPFKITSRDTQGVMVTLIADNYFGYCKKEVKTQISYAANLFGLAEEEHAGGALAFATYNLGDSFTPDQVRIVTAGHRFAEVIELLGDSVAACSRSGYATDVIYPEIHYVPEDVEIDVHRQDITLDPATARSSTSSSCPAGSTSTRAATRSGWRSTTRRRAGGWSGRCRRAPSATSPAPSPAAASRRSARAWSTRSCTGRSSCRLRRGHGAGRRRSSSRSYDDAPRRARGLRARPILSPDRSLGSVIKLLTPSPRTSRPSTTPGSRAFPTTSGRWCSSSSASTGRSGATTGAALQRRHHQRRARARAEVRGPQAGRQLPARRARGGRRLADLQAAAGLRRGRQGADGGRHHGVGRGARARGWSGCPASTTGTRASSSRRTASSACSSGPTTRSIPASTSRPRRTWRARGSSAPTSSRSAASDAQRIVRGRRGPRRVHRADARARRAERRRAPTTATRLLGQPAAGRRQAHQEPALPPAPPRPARPRDRYLAEMGARL